MLSKGVDTLVLYTEIPKGDISLPLTPSARQMEIDSVANMDARREKYFVWKLLERAVREYLKLDFANLEFTKNENGKWLCPDFFFSLSHTAGAVCVAVSSSPVGVDIERVHSLGERLFDRFLTDREKEGAVGLTECERSDFFLECWVKKESLFKLSGEGALMPRERETVGSSARAHRVTLSDGEYLIGVATHDNEYELLYTEEI